MMIEIIPSPSAKEKYCVSILNENDNLVLHGRVTKRELSELRDAIIDYQRREIDNKMENLSDQIRELTDKIGRGKNNDDNETMIEEPIDYSEARPMPRASRRDS